MEKGEIIVLEEREYACVSTAKNDNQTYLYLMTVDKPLEIRFAKQLKITEDEIEIEVIYNQEEKESVLQLFQENMQNEINN